MNIVASQKGEVLRMKRMSWTEMSNGYSLTPGSFLPSQRTNNLDEKAVYLKLESGETFCSERDGPEFQCFGG